MFVAELFSDYYAVLGVARTASHEEIKRAYRRLAVQYHPDRNPGDHAAEERFKACVEAYAVLSQSDKRRHYDQAGHAAFTSQGGAAGIDLAEVLESIRDMFRSGKRHSRHPNDVSYNLDISFEEAARGAEKPIHIDRQVPCPECAGTGAAVGTVPSTCLACKGRGEMRSGKGLFAGIRDCDACRGIGQIVESPCPRCMGKRVVQRTEALMVQVPAGIEHGNTRTVRGAGDCTPTKAGDLHVTIRIQQHPIYQREGADIHCTIAVTYPQLVLGDQLEVPTVDGPVLLKLPPGTSAGKVFRLRGKGFPVLGQYGKGDQYVHIEVDIPSKVTARQRELLKQLHMTMTPKPRSKPPQ